MNILRNDVSAFLLARQFAHESGATFSATMGCLYDEQGQLVPFASAQAWLAERFPGTAYDSGLKKSGGSFGVYGSAHSSSGSNAPVQLRAQCGRIVKTLVAYPERHWVKTLFGWTACARDVFTPVAVLPAASYGGAKWPDNREGLGHFDNPENAQGQALPRVETPDEPILRPGDQRAIATFARLPPECAQRRRYLGTFDERWARYEAPFLPKDTDPRWYDEFPDDQCQQDYWNGLEHWSVEGMNAECFKVSGSLQGGKPRLFVAFSAQAPQEIAPLALDTILLFPQERHVLTLHRALLPTSDIDGQDIEGIAVIFEAPSTAPLSSQAWIEKLWPITTEPATNTPVTPATARAECDQAAAARAEIQQRLQAYQARLDALDASALARVRTLATKTGLPLPSLPNQPAIQLDLNALPSPRFPDRPFDAKALTDQVEASLEQSEALTHKSIAAMAKRLGIPTPTMPAAPLANAPSSLLKAIEQLPMGVAQKQALSAQVSGVLAANQQLEHEIGTALAGVLKLQIPAISPPSLPAQPHTWTREDVLLSSNEVIKKAQLDALDLTDCVLVQKTWENSTFNKCRFDRSTLTGGNFRNARFIGCTFTDTVFDDVDLTSASLEDCVLTRTQINASKATGLNCRNSDLSGCTFERTSFSASYFQGCRCTGINVSDSQSTTTRWVDCDLTEAIFANADFTKAGFDNCTLVDARYNACSLVNTAWSRCDGSRCEFVDVAGTSSRFDHKSCFDHARFIRSVLTQSSMMGVSMTHALFDRVRLDAAFVADCDLSHSRGVCVNAVDGFFSGSRFCSAQWPNTNFLRANLRKTDISHAEFDGSNLHAAVTEGIKGEAASYQGALLTRCRIREDLGHD